MTTSYRARSIKRARRTAGEIETIKSAMIDLLQDEHPMTVRQVFYQMVSRGVIPKTEAQYKQTVCRLLIQLRREGVLPYDWIADNTRLQRKPRSFQDLDDALEFTAKTYRRALWGEQGVYVEVWCEKDALSGILYDVTYEYDVPLMISRGFSSLSFLHSAGEFLRTVDVPAYLYYFGDHDPSGVEIDRKIESEIRGFAPDAEIYFERVAVKREQILSMGLPTRPTKTTDSRSKSFEGESVELDAIPPSALRDLCRNCIERHIDLSILESTKRIEEKEREVVRQIAESGWPQQS
jgi:hypothetical protein